ncbi:MAG: DNA-directed RNA polymerase subunit omega [Firmicutes bacterium]|nr:DNA-directed RNA polymerase subunit omega [Bacillota bacterium]
MVDPRVEAMIEQSPSKYALVIAVARRARELLESDDPEARDRPVSRALAEITLGEVAVDDWSETYGYGIPYSEEGDGEGQDGRLGEGRYGDG